MAAIPEVCDSFETDITRLAACRVVREGRVHLRSSNRVFGHGLQAIAIVTLAILLAMCNSAVAAGYWNIQLIQVSEGESSDDGIARGVEYKALITLSNIDKSRSSPLTFSRPVFDNDPLTGPFAALVSADLKKGQLPPRWDLVAVMARDTAYFEDEGVSIKEFAVDRQKLAQIVGETDAAQEATGSGGTAAKGRQEIIAGQAEISLTARREVPNGAAYFSVSFWARRGPIGEMEQYVCMLRVPCFTTEGKRLSLRGFDSWRSSTSENNGYPDLALTLLQTSEDLPPRALLVVNSGDQVDAKVWTLDQDWFTLITEISKFMHANHNDFQDQRKGGRQLFDLFFPDTPSRPDGKIAREFFRRIASQRVTGQVALGKDRMPTLAFRLLRNGATLPSILPIGLIYFGDDKAVREDLWVGNFYRVESVLPNQRLFNVPSTNADDPCVGNFQFVGPPPNTGDPALQAAANGLIKTKRMNDSELVPFAGFALGGYSIPIKTNQDTLDAWISREDAIEDRATLVSVIAHHGNNEIGFGDGLGVPAQSIKLRFSKASALIMNACSTIAISPRESGILRRLSVMGFQSIIATIKDIEGEMAARFSSCTAEAIETIKPGEWSYLSDLFMQAVRCTAGAQKDGAAGFGPKALRYVLLGNSRMRICRPDSKY